jgi:hypothetical protein
MTTTDVIIPLPQWVKDMPDDLATKKECWPPRSKDHTIDWERPTNELYHDPHHHHHHYHSVAEESLLNLVSTSTTSSRFKAARQKLDYSYHRNPAKSRQELQDAILSRVVQAAAAATTTTTTTTEEEAKAASSVTTPTPPRTRRPWIIFSAGPMGVGKGYVMSTLNERGLFPMDHLLKIDPDKIKSELPEMAGYLSIDPASAATKVHRESTQMADILLEHALQLRIPTLVDGSLRDVDYYRSLMDRIRTEFPEYQLAILHVTASAEIIRSRAEMRAKTTGRAVPEDLLEESIAQVPKSVEALAPHVDITFTISNEDDQPIQLVDSKIGTSHSNNNNNRVMNWRQFRDTWWSNLNATEEENNKLHTICHLKSWCESQCPGISEMATCWRNDKCIDAAKQAFSQAYPSYCPTCSLGADIQCGICIHEKYYCKCTECSSTGYKQSCAIRRD